MTNIAIIWASNNPEKFWNKIIKDLVWKWFWVYPVNPHSDYINNIKSYKNLEEIQDNIDIYNFVTQPSVTFEIVKNNTDLLMNKQLCFQPWSTDDKMEKYLIDNNFINYKTNSCIMINKI